MAVESATDLSARPSGFTTEKGSTYSWANGASKRDKAARPGHEDSGPKRESDKTVFISPEDAREVMTVAYRQNTSANTVTGSIWAKFTWGSFWNWDPRETSIFVLLLIYGAYFALRSAVDQGDEKKANLSAVYAIIAGVTVPFFIFIMPRIISGLHPNEAFVSQGKINMNTLMLSIFLSSLVGFTGLFFWLFNLKVRIDHLYDRKEK